MYEDLKKESQNRREGLERLWKIVKVLRKECPWDREQTHASLRPCMIEEAYEVAEAIDCKDGENLKEELGDVLLQVLFHSLMGEERGDFDLTDVINDECEKMIRRHPHIFSTEEAKCVDKVLEKWENIKVNEDRDQSHTTRLKKVPKALPALTRSYKVQKRAAQGGFDWNDASGAFQKLDEETRELLEAWKDQDKEAIDEELGDLLFSVVNVARFAGVNPEAALERSTEKFIRRFQGVEERATKAGTPMKDMSLEELDLFWEEAKKREVDW